MAMGALSSAPHIIYILILIELPLQLAYPTHTLAAVQVYSRDRMSGGWPALRLPPIGMDVREDWNPISTFAGVAGLGGMDA